MGKPLLGWGDGEGKGCLTDPSEYPVGGHWAAPRGLQLLFQKGLSDGPEASGLCSPQAQ